MKIRIHVDAEVEIESAWRYFNSQAFALGERFLDDLAQTLEKVEAAPESFPKIETLPDTEPYLRALLNVFRYAVIFEVLDEEVLVVAVAHTRRMPNYWLNRRP